MPAENVPVVTHIQRPLPEPLFAQPYQSGITDPKWPLAYPATVQPDALRDYLQYQIESGRLGKFDVETTTEEELKEQYDADYAGHVDRQEFQSLMRADVRARSREEFKNVLKLIAEFALGEMSKKPSKKHVRLLEPIPDSYRVTLTVGFGASLFVDKTGWDRFGLRSQKPKFLKSMPSFEGDAAGFDPTQAASDLILVVSSDHPYINVAIVRYFAEYFNKRFSQRHHQAGTPYNVLEFRKVEEGFARKDKREYLKFDDGIDNIRMGADDLERLVYVDESDNEPDWCLRGSYMVYRKIRENMPVWEAFSDAHQEGFIGREKKSGLPLSREKTGPGGLTPVYPDPKNAADGPLNSHVRKVQPRRPFPDLFGLDDRERRFLRRPYPFFDGLGDDGKAINGLQFVAYMKSIQQQFEHVVNMWQMNPHFPVPDTGPDALYAKGVLSTIDGGYFFCPPGLTGEGDYYGSGMFQE